LRAAIERVAGTRRDLPVVLSADARSEHHAVVTALEALGEEGFEKVSIATTPEAKK
jgi:biopolymer transport protein ExbD